jgi:hypothetical protein
MKTCAYCGRENEEHAANCRDCGSSLLSSEGAHVRFRMPGMPKWVVGSLAVFATIAEVVFLGVILPIMLVIGSVFRTTYPPQPQLGYTGEWRMPYVIGVEERPLPPAEDLWREYEEWQPKTQHARRVYVARLGDASRQFHFRSSTNKGDTPLGAQHYTDAYFGYVDPTNGTYAISWELRGKHDASFLRFDTNQRLYQLQPYGSPDDKPPRFSIQAIEGIKPDF